MENDHSSTNYNSDMKNNNRHVKEEGRKKNNKKRKFEENKFKYHGLRNQGATCYLNSVLQVLFMTKDFREAVERQVSSNFQEQEPFDHHLNMLFENLKDKETHTEDITFQLRIMNVSEQRDAAEYFEKILSMVHPDVSKIFKGKLRHSTTCSAGHLTSDETVPFWTLPLSMKDRSDHEKSYSVIDGFKAFFEPLTVGGDNEMYCDDCNAKTEATTECKMVDHPEVLTLLLKRFEFDYGRMSYVKISNCVDVPQTLQKGGQEYELYAIVDHSGSLRGGHYTAKIKSYKDGKWYLFDDSYVSLLSLQPNKQSDIFERSRSAYLLMYRKLNQEATRDKVKPTA